jgi:hypothetical protein
VIGAGIKTRTVKVISTNFIKKEICLRNHCHPRSPRVRGKEFENNCLDTFEDPRTGDKSITESIHVYASEL